MMDRKEEKENQRIVVTGIGMVTPLGIGKKEFCRRLFAGETAVDTIQSFDTAELPSHCGAEVTDFNPRDFISVKNIRRMDRISLFTAAAARLALDDAGLQINEGNRDRIGILLGTSFGATDVTVQFARTLIEEGPSLVNPILVPNTVMNAAAGHTSIELGFRGVNTTVTHYAVSAETAIAYAASEIRRGAADFILTGGVDILSKFYYEALTRFYSTSPRDGKTEASRPFDRRRNGMVPGEGCGLLCMETLQSAERRGKKPYCEIKGCGQSSSAVLPTAWPGDAGAIVRTLRRALSNAGMEAAEVGAIMAAANGGILPDRAEALAYEEIFATCAAKPFLTSVKGALGESFSGGGIRACALAASLEEGFLPPTVGLSDPEISGNYVTGQKRELNPGNAVLAGISFGGTYAYIIFSGNEISRE